MASVVYALHDFAPEHEDEINFVAGERIEVVERDDLYGDGWWRGRNLAGKVGLFPQSYTTTAPPADAPATPAAPTAQLPPAAPPETESTTLQPLAEEPESDSGSPVSPPPQIYLNGNTDPASDPNGEVMKATMTDVQKAIEQLGSRNRGSSANLDQDARSFSFASTRDDRTTDDEDDTDFDMSEGEGWHKGARRKLAEKARQAVADAEKLEALSSGAGGGRMVAPPIAVELSDESDAEDDHDHDEEDDDYASSPLRAHPYIPEEDEPSEPFDQLGRLRAPEEVPATAPATATAHSFAVHAEVPPTPVSAGIPAPSALSIASPAPVQQDRVGTPLRESLAAGLPSPAPSGGAAAIGSKHSSIASSTVGALATGVPSKPSSVASAPLSVLSEGRRRDDSGHASGSGGSANGAAKHPSEWSVEEVVDWIKSKGFDEDVCDKFTEQEITGDVLLDLDVNLLKTEIGIMAFGKRMRIANAIVELRRPPSPSASFSLPHSPQHPQYAVAYANSQNSQPYPNSPQYTGHSRTQSQSHSQQSYNGHNSMQSSVGSPLQNGYLAQTYGVTAGLISPESATHAGNMPKSPLEMQTIPDGDRTGIPLGLLGETSGTRSKGRPAQLMLSPSDGALNVSATQTTEPEAQEDERAVMSESEHPAKASIRGRLFGSRSPVGSPHSGADKESQASGNSKDKDQDSSVEIKSTDGKATSKKKDSSNTVATGPGRHARGKKSIDGNNPGKGNERLSIFGASFGGTLGRKPAPRYSGGPEDEKVDKSSSGFTLPRLNRKNGRPSTPSSGLSPVHQTTPDNAQVVPQPPVSPNNPTLLRKRTSSSHATDAAKASTTAAAAIAAPGGNAASKLKPGQSILDQIGEPDHIGWMRKKGDRYNSWKLRYFVLKGPDFYCLRSSNKAETKIKGYINIVGYKVTVDENVNPGRYGFRIDHENDKTHYFSSDEKTVVRDWMKAIMKATIGRDYSKPVVSSCNIPTIPLMVAQAMNPAPRPPSPTARAATQRAMRRENTDQPSTRDARVLMLTGFASNTGPKEERARLDSFFTSEAVPVDNAPGAGSPPASPQSVAPPRPTRRMSSQQAPTPVDEGLIEWANGHLPSKLQITDPAGPLCDGLGLLRLAESIKGRPSSPPVPDSAFPKDDSDDNLDGLFRLFDFLLDNEVRMGSVSIQDIRRGKRDKIVQLLRGLKAWEDKRKAIATSIGKGSAQAGGFMAPAWSGM
ncbi:hypothetical protein B0H15DRAFT_201781 [Mycena belliarum]|uniref:Uncharacterized protein n=1 Tax=Mycena belliarum TaxID=1033014 RepID=A0AAD6UK97_9AGAR|nr:hypothetical protein B0H15DRAFT_201781 [Mycena belliae]